MCLSRTPITNLAVFALLLLLSAPQRAHGLGPDCLVPAAGPPDCEVDSDCDDYNLCTDDTCNPNTGVCSNDWIDCDDNDCCTYDYCYYDTGCYYEAVDTSDGDACTIDGCHPIDCATNTPIDCDDGDPCTNNDCDSQEGCVNSPIDCQGDVPDVCDCNGNGVTDECDITEGSSPDCNGNGSPDECDIAAGISEDCNINGFPDECEVTTSPQFSPFGRDWPWYFSFVNPPPAEGDVTISFHAVGDLDETYEEVYVTFNSTHYLGPIFQTEGSHCPDEPDVAELVLSAETFNAFVDGGNAEIFMLSSSQVSPYQCEDDPFISVALLYEPGMPDQNDNGVPDACDCPGDLNGDWTVTAADLAELLGDWGPCPDCPADIDGDGVVNAFDLAILLGAWGLCL